jgi:hypothetical protein
MKLRHLSSLLALALLAPGAEAGTLRVSYPAFERVLVADLLTQGGRLYLQGAAETDCTYAFVQEPRAAAEGHRLRIRLLFSGRGAVSVAGKCVGPGGTFDIDISGVPAYADGTLRLEEVKVSAPQSKYFNLVSRMVEDQLRERMQYPLKLAVDHAAAHLSSVGSTRISVPELRVDEVAVEPEGLRLKIDFDLSVE